MSGADRQCGVHACSIELRRHADLCYGPSPLLPARSRGSLMTPTSARLVGAAFVASLFATPTYAQTPPVPPGQTTQSPSLSPSNSKVSHWGVFVSLSPSWDLPSSITNSVAKDGGTLIVVGSQFTIGIVHGRTLSGDWGVTFVHQAVKNGSRGSSSD